jgi:hypothetical protein
VLVVASSTVEVVTRGEAGCQASDPADDEPGGGRQPDLQRPVLKVVIALRGLGGGRDRSGGRLFGTAAGSSRGVSVIA